MHPLVKTCLAVLAVSAVVIVWLAYDAAANEEAWTQLAKARSQGMTVEALQAARADSFTTSPSSPLSTSSIPINAPLHRTSPMMG